MADIQSLLAPSISPAPEAAPFWEAADRHELLLPFCGTCEQFFFYPRTLCPVCGSRDVQWRPASGRGRLYTFCIQYRNSVPGLEKAVPFVTAMVQLDEGPRLMTFLIGIEPDPKAIVCDMPVELDFLDLHGGHSLPVFRPARSS
ncbi:OB-fold domain-containing protein [Parafrigoribacterium mesophilum]|uniref:Zn-ribbon domain-containing OB-fold protein n=1 Tax=Parafrigoribacterium mesophilum TaxID=433646 RepID=UPI0031FC77B0